MKRWIVRPHGLPITHELTCLFWTRWGAFRYARHLRSVGVTPKVGRAVRNV